MIVRESGVAGNGQVAGGRRKRSEARKTGAGAGAVQEKSPFQQIIDEVLPSDGPEGAELNQLWRELPLAERDLLDHPSNENLARYKDLVFDIARETLRRNAKVVKLRRRNSKGEMVELSLVEFVDLRLQKMATIITSSGNSAFQLLKTVEEIRGALLDVRE